MYKTFSINLVLKGKIRNIITIVVGDLTKVVNKLKS